MTERVIAKRSTLSLLAASLSLSICGCAMPRMTAPDVGGAAHAAHQGADAVRQGAEERLPGVSDAMDAPLRDLNLVDDNVPTSLVRAYAKPYDAKGLDSCQAILDQVSALDLVLGPDVDIPRSASAEEDMFAKGRGLAGDAALDAVRSATLGVIPVRSWVRRFSGASRAEQEAKAIVLAGSIRRGFLKAMGEMHHCDWPAAPLDLQKAALQARALGEAEKSAISDLPKATMVVAGSRPAGTAQP